MSVFLRSMLVLSVTSLLLVGCGEKEAVSVEAAPVAATPAEGVTAPAEAGGYEPTAEERVPGVTLDAAETPAVEAAPEVK